MAITKTELEKYYLDEMLEQQGYTSQTDFYTKLLTEGAKTAQESAKAYYDPIAEQAGKQASYDISGAYASYLKQQQNIAAQSGLESGYKEEVGSGLKSAYDSAYQQAKATEAQTLASAAEKASSIYSSGVESAQKTITSQLEAMANEAAQRAKLFKATEEYATQDLTGDLYKEYYYDVDKQQRTGEGVYKLNTETGEYEITDLGKDLYAKAMLGDADSYKAYLEEQGLLDYYLANQGTVTKDLFGIDNIVIDSETGEKRPVIYDESSEESKLHKYGTEGYIDQQIKQNRSSDASVSVDLIGAHGGAKYYLGPRSLGGLTSKQTISDISENVVKYYESLGLTTEDVVTLLGDDIKSILISKADEFGKQKNLQGWLDYYEQLIPQLEQAAKKKYGV